MTIKPPRLIDALKSAMSLALCMADGNQDPALESYIVQVFLPVLIKGTPMCLSRSHLNIYRRLQVRAGVRERAILSAC